MTEFDCSMYKLCKCERLFNLDRMIDDQIDRTKRVDFLRITPEGFDCISHRGKVHNGRDPSKILKRRKYIYK